MTLELILLSLATWRVSSLLAREDGPFDIFIKLRLLTGMKFNDASEEKSTNRLSKGLMCVWCNSLYISALASLIIATDALWWLIYTLAISTITIIIDEVVT